jgi:hypothetical protein
MKNLSAVNVPAVKAQGVSGAAGNTRLSDPAVAPDVAALKQRLRDDPSFSRQLLREAGILTTRGKLAKSFGG